MSGVRHQYQDLITIFNRCFEARYNTKLVKGDTEPVYLPANGKQPYHAIFFAHGFFSSALHECAHWLIAGKERRKQVDYGYWYEPDGRTAEQQIIFQRVEAKPQALEWILSVAAGYRFYVSVDNLNGQALDVDAFKQAIYQQVVSYCERGLPQRAAHFRQELCQFYATPSPLMIEQFSIEKI
ncbi:elongation factor P hydroxylase [Legionella cardiaca]|uniref:Elongation factor P hydroxylase n=1 Tax=Legionella cardiaca TaxID=1071983 RepID=A0ABY8ASA9_9GAMM|nr:elongation factor P hydroxylase [Legionella cardiaca]WED43408.1 elongation factor P hydroxylase [Legionella cardiaca]